MKRSVIIILSTAMALSLSACAQNGDGESVAASKLNYYEAAVQSLSDKLAAAEKAHEQLKGESEKALDELREELDALKEQAAAQKPDSDVQDAPSADEIAALGFKYIITDGCASITGYDGGETKITVPSSVGEYKVTSIADGAFEGSEVTDVIISDGIDRIGWFAFRGCDSLKSLTIPSSVLSIGYGALGEAGSSPFIYCHADSFALSYAKSYGLSYAVI